MLQFVSNQVGDFPDLFEDQMNAAGSMQSAATAPPRPSAPTPQTPRTPTPQVYQNPGVGLAPSQTLSPQSLPLTPPLTPAQTPSPTAAPTTTAQITRSPPLLQPRPQLVQPLQPQQATQPAIQVRHCPSFVSCFHYGFNLLCIVVIYFKRSFSCSTSW